MELALLHLLFIINAFDLTTENPILYYRFHVNRVERCPMNAAEFETAARKRNCTGNNRYLCAPDRNLSSLIEFCTDTYRSLFEKGNCLRLEGTGDLNHFHCVERFVSGCPTEPYADDEIYKYPSCLELDLKFNCFVAEKNCQMRLLTTTDKYFNNSKDGDVLKNAEPETFEGSSKLQIVIVIVYGFLYVAILTASVVIYIYKREIYKNGDVKEKNIKEDIQSCVKEKESICYRSLSGEKEGELFLKGVKTISDVRENLAKKLGVTKGILYVVDENNGTLWDDNNEIKGLPETLTLMIALDESRMKQTLDGDNKIGADGNDTNHRQIMRDAGNFEMKCIHFKDADSWFCWTRTELLQNRHADLHCPKCDSSLDLEEIEKNCKMTPDEKIFFEKVQNLNNLHENLVIACQKAVMNDY